MDRPVRKRLRLEGYNYADAPACFATVCIANMAKRLGEILPPEQDNEKPQIRLTVLGQTVEETIQKIPGIDKYVVMPNHIHFIFFNPKHQTVSAVLQRFKINVARKTKIDGLWERSFYEHIIRDEADYQIKWKYIDDNPARWAKDRYYI